MPYIKELWNITTHMYTLYFFPFFKSSEGNLLPFYFIKVLSHKADTYPRQVTSCDMYVFIQFNAVTWRMDSN